MLILVNYNFLIKVVEKGAKITLFPINYNFLVKVTEKIANITTTKRKRDGLKLTFSLKFSRELSGSKSVNFFFFIKYLLFEQLL